MPFVARPLIVPPVPVNPRPRIRLVPVVNADPHAPEPSDDREVKPQSAATRPIQAEREKRQPTGDYPEGYCRAPVRTRFQAGNSGGPGRPKKDNKSQDELMRAELLKSQHVTEGGHRRRRTTRELIPRLLVKTTLQKLNPKELRALHDEGRRLFPERLADAASVVVLDPQAERAYLREMLAAIQLGESDAAGADPLADVTSGVFEAHDAEEDDGSWDEGDWDASHQEPTDETA